MSQKSTPQTLEQMLQLVVRTTPDGFWAIDLNGRFLDVNDAYCRMLGYDRNELLQLHVWDVDALSNKEAIQEWIQSITSAGSIKFETMHRKKDGSVIDVEVTSSYTLEAGGYLLGFCREIADKKSMETDLRHTTMLLSRSQAIAHVGSWEYRIEEDQLIWSEEVYRIFGYQPMEIPVSLELFMEHVHPDDRELMDHAYLDSVARGDDGFSVEYRILPKGSSSVRYVIEKYEHIKDDAGNVVSSVGMIQDITESMLATASLRASEEQLRKSQQVARLGSYSFDMTTGKWVSSEYMDKIFGIDENYDKTIEGWLRLVHPDDVKQIEAYLQDEVILDGNRFDLEYRVINVTTGKTIWVQGLGDLRLDAQGNPIEMVGTIQDITERKTAESELNNLRDRQRAMIKNISDVIAILDTSGTVTYKSENLESLFGWKPEEMVGRSGWETIHPDDVESAREVFQNLLTSEGKKATIEFRYKCKNGEYRPVEMTATSLLTDPLINGILLNYRDISERKKAEESREQSEERFKALHNASFGGIAIHDKGLILECNQGLSDISGFSYEELIGMDGLKLIAPASREIVMKNITSGYEKSYEVTGVRKNGEEYPIRLEARNIPFKGRQVRVTEFRDITKQKQDEQALRESEEHTRSILAAIPDMLFEFDSEGKTLAVYAPDPDQLFMPQEEILNKSLYEVFGPAMANMAKMVIDEVLQLDQPIEFGYSLQGKDRVIYYEGRMVPKGQNRTLLVTRDVSNLALLELERARLQHELLHSQKMETVGRLAGGVAHDFNNMLGVIIGNIELLRTRSEQYWQKVPELEEIDKAANRSAELTRQLLAFARKQTITPKNLDLNGVVEGMLNMLTRLIGENIKLTWTPAANLKTVRMDPSQVDQVVTNLVVNARDAIDRIGEIIIETRNVVVGNKPDRAFPNLKPGYYTALTVSDTGHGMDEEVKGNLFEPFFTTKAMGEGTGLGLATVYGIVQQNEGHITVQSEIGKGATFTLYLPAVEEKVELPRSKQADHKLPSGSETILLVEDEGALLRLTKRMLENLGYKVLATDLPSTAIQMAEDCTNQIDLLISDIMMPEMDGSQLSAILRKIQPEMQVLLMSGYTSTSIASRQEISESENFMQKPFTQKVLAETVRQVLMRSERSKESK